MLKRKTAISALSTLDLRRYTPEALGQIKSIRAVALILLPENPDPEFVSAYAQIKKGAIARELNLSVDTAILSGNGLTVLNNNSVVQNSIYITNGMLLAGMIDKEKNISVIVNGMVIVKKGSAVYPISVNGEFIETDFDENKVKTFSNELKIDQSFIRCTEKGVFLIVGNRLIIDKDVTEDAIIEKDIRFAAGNLIVCSKELFGCIQNRANVGNKIITHEEYLSYKKKYGRNA